MARPTEIKAIVGLLDQEHPDVESLAKAVIETLDDLRLSRPTFAIRLAWDDDDRFGIGPFENRQQARSHLIGTQSRRGIAPAIPKEEADRYIVELKPLGWWTGEVATPKAGTCSECGHPTHTHNWPKYRRKRAGCIVYLDPRNPTDHCPCTGDGS